jgi:hypothetical protein
LGQRKTTVWSTSPGKIGVLTFRSDLKKSYDYDQEAIEYASTTLMQLSQMEMVILAVPPQKKLGQSTMKPNTNDIDLKTI